MGDAVLLHLQKLAPRGATHIDIPPMMGGQRAAQLRCDRSVATGNVLLMKRASESLRPHARVLSQKLLKSAGLRQHISWMLGTEGTATTWAMRTLGGLAHGHSHQPACTNIGCSWRQKTVWVQPGASALQGTLGVPLA